MQDLPAAMRKVLQKSLLVGTKGVDLTPGTSLVIKQSRAGLQVSREACQQQEVSCFLSDAGFGAASTFLTGVLKMMIQGPSGADSAPRETAAVSGLRAICWQDTGAPPESLG